MITRRALILGSAVVALLPHSLMAKWQAAPERPLRAYWIGGIDDGDVYAGYDEQSALAAAAEDYGYTAFSLPSDPPRDSVQQLIEDYDLQEGLEPCELTYSMWLDEFRQRETMTTVGAVLAKMKKPGFICTTNW